MVIHGVDIKRQWLQTLTVINIEHDTPETTMDADIKSDRC